MSRPVYGGPPMRSYRPIGVGMGLPAASAVAMMGRPMGFGRRF